MRLSLPSRAGMSNEIPEPGVSRRNWFLSVTMVALYVITPAITSPIAVAFIETTAAKQRYVLQRGLRVKSTHTTLFNCFSTSSRLNVSFDIATETSSVAGGKPVAFRDLFFFPGCGGYGSPAKTAFA